MSYGRSGLIKCHAEDPKGQHEYVEQKYIQEAFQPQKNHSLALKPKIFIIQVSNSEIKRGKRFEFMVFNATFNNISDYIVAVSFIGEGNRTNLRKPLTCSKSLTNFII
jgi:hypothetical protein